MGASIYQVVISLVFLTDILSEPRVHPYLLSKGSQGKEERDHLKPLEALHANKTVNQKQLPTPVKLLRNATTS